MVTGGKLLEASIPYERQLDADDHQRMCGAAALCMVYRSLGIAAAQARVWPKIARPDEHGGLCARTRLICRDALDRGLQAQIIRARNPWALLRQCMERDVRTIVNHRISLGSTAGHYSVVVGIGDDEIVLHDPQRGPERRVPRAEFESMWRPHHCRSEIVGDVLVAIAEKALALDSCPQCQRKLPAAAPCPRCRQEVALPLGELVGCMEFACEGRMWKRLYCHHCDSGL